MKVVLLESLNITDQRLKELEAPFIERGITFAAYERTDDPDQIIAEAAEAEVLITANMPLGNEVIAEFRKTKFIDVAFTGVDHIGLDACRKKNIAVSNASGYASEAVSELAVGSVLSLYRQLRRNEDRLRKGETKESVPGMELAGKTVGLIGLGRIGMRTAELFHAFGCRITASRRHPAPSPDWIEMTSTDELLKASDIVILCCPLNESTRGMIDASRIAMMKSSAVLVNMARGPVVQTADLVQALIDHQIAGAVSDVYDQEPPLAQDSALLHAPNTLLTPHIGFFTKEAMEERADIVFDNLDAWLKGKQKNIILS